MTISGDYSTPVTVNGYQCRNCTDVAYAKKNIDPQHPKSGPYGIDAKDDPTAKQNQAVSFGGGLSKLNATGGQPPGASPQPPADSPANSPGSQLDLTA